MYNVEKIGHSNVDNFGFRNELQHAHGINNLYDLENNSSVKLRNPIRRRNVETINFDEYEQSLQQHNSDFKCSNDESKTNDILINTFPCPPSAPPILPSIQQTVPPAPPAPTAPNSSNNEEIKDELNLEKPSLENIDFNKRTSLYPSL